MPWLLRTWQIWKLSFYRDSNGALFVRWGRSKPKRFGWGKTRVEALPPVRKTVD